jgi:hypothetical protein
MVRVRRVPRQGQRIVGGLSTSTADVADDRIRPPGCVRRVSPSATSESRRSSRPGAGRTIAFAPAALWRCRRARLRNATIAITRAEGSASGSEWSSAEPQSSAEWSSISLIGRLRVTTIADASRGSGDARDAAQRTRSHRGERYRSVLAEFAAAAMSLIRIIRCSGSVGEGSKPWRR